MHIGTEIHFLVHTVYTVQNSYRLNNCIQNNTVIQLITVIYLQLLQLLGDSPPLTIIHLNSYLFVIVATVTKLLQLLLLLPESPSTLPLLT